MANAKKITELLFKKYPRPRIALNFGNPFELLIATMLSAQCTDVKVNEVVKNLFKKYKTPEDYAKADINRFELEISSITYYKNKAKMIIDCCKKIIKDFHGKVPQTMKELITLPGVGRKTANVILGSAFGKQSIPVDTHVLRVSNRLGLAHSSNPEKVEQELMGQIPRDKWTSFSLALILHGRETCTAKNPKCRACILYPECDWPEKKSPDLSAEEIKSLLSGRTKTVGNEILFFDSINSTNTAAMELAGSSREGTVVIADEQTGGKGRLGRTWLSPPGKNLYMSIILKPSISPRDAAILTLMSAVACATAIKRVSSVPASIKWPNDIMVSGRKLGGILTEIKADMDRIFHAVVGIGININLDTDDMPDDINAFATSIRSETGISHSRTLLAAEILKEMDRWYGMLMNAGKKPIMEEWLKLSSTIGRAVKVTVGDNVFTGIAGNIDEEGMLILKLPDNSLKKISAGDVTILR